MNLLSRVVLTVAALICCGALATALAKPPRPTPTQAHAQQPQVLDPLGIAILSMGANPFAYAAIPVTPDAVEKFKAKHNLAPRAEVLKPTPTAGHKLLYLSPEEATSGNGEYVKFAAVQAFPLQLGDMVWYGSKPYLVTEIKLSVDNGWPIQFVLCEPVKSQYGKLAAQLQSKPTAWLLSAERKEIEKIGPAATIAIERPKVEMQSVEATAD